ncbi:MAG: LysR family transcriptional regulator [Alteromonadaceae bacterium]|nr:LysR family transcriptional regulator [Alteromonadaceae bacterium]
MFELKHLKNLSTLQQTGNMRKAAEALFISQSALSHQLKELENRLNNTLFIRNTSPVEFTEQGRILLNAATEILPQIELANNKLKQKPIINKSLRLAMSCHACLQWLLPVLDSIKKHQPQLKFEFVDPTFEQRAAHNYSQPYSRNSTNRNETEQEYNLLFTDEYLDSDTANTLYQQIGEFEVIAVIHQNHLLAVINFLKPKDFIDETLLTYPVDKQQLDVFKLFLTPENCQPKNIKHVTNSHLMLQMVAANMGIATMPDWLVKSLTVQSLIEVKKLGEHGVFKNLYVKYRKDNEFAAIITDIVPLAVNAFIQLYQQRK